jgi:DNA-3-methyladenine glycosylase I
MSTGTVDGPDGQPRCRWCAAAPEFLGYHDHEWGFPVADDRRLFEKLCLESFQSGLSWRTILAKRENFRAAFVWRYEPPPHERAEPQTASTSAASIALSKELKKRGWKFVGPTTVYAFMQAMGLVNDHVAGCTVQAGAAAARKRFQKPR